MAPLLATGKPMPTCIIIIIYLWSGSERGLWDSRNHIIARLFVLPDMSHVGLCHRNTDYLVLRHHNGGIVGRCIDEHSGTMKVFGISLVIMSEVEQRSSHLQFSL